MADEKIIQDEMEVTKRQMEETRASLAAKLDTLESKVTETVQGATDAVNTVKSTVESTVETVKESVEDTVSGIRDTVQGTVSGFKESVQDTVQSVKSAFDLEAHYQQHPWLMIGGSVALGFVGGMILHPAPSAPAASELPRTTGFGGSLNTGNTTSSPTAGNGHGHRSKKHDSQRSASKESGWIHSLMAQVSPEIDMLKNMAVSSLLNMAEEWITPNIPPAIKPQFKEMMGDITTKLTGSPPKEHETASKAPGFSEERRFAS